MRRIARSILDAAARIKNSEDRLRWATGYLSARVAKCTEVDGGISENLLWTLTNLSCLRNKFVI